MCHSLRSTGTRRTTSSIQIKKQLTCGNRQNMRSGTVTMTVSASEWKEIPKNTALCASSGITELRRRQLLTWTSTTGLDEGLKAVKSLLNSGKQTWEFSRWPSMRTSPNLSEWSMWTKHSPSWMRSLHIDSTKTLMKSWCWGPWSSQPQQIMVRPTNQCQFLSILRPSYLRNCSLCNMIS